MSTIDYRYIDGFPKYRITPWGTIQSCHSGEWRDIRTHLRNGRRGEQRGGYYWVVLCDRGKRSQRAVHVMVAEAFHGPRPEGLVVRHRDGVRTNNHPDNLRWGTEAQNVQDAVSHGANSLTRLTPAQVIEIRESTETARQIALRMGTSRRNVYNIRTRKSWKHI